MTTWLYHLRLFDGEAIRNDMAVAIDDGMIGKICPRADMPATDNAIDLGGQLLAPGFIDLQVNGGGGIMVNDRPDATGLARIMSAHRQYGTTAMLPTLISDNWDMMKATATSIRQAVSQGIPGIIGVHFEGPYLNPARKGVHREAVLRQPDPEALDLFSDPALGKVMVTVAPEIVPMDFIRAMHQAGIQVCAGHTAADYDTIIKALDSGLGGFTHLFNAMSPYTSREPGVVGAALEAKDAFCGIIVDGYHVHDASLRVAHAAKAAGKMVLVTDAMATVGAEDKRFSLYGDVIYAKDGRCATDDGTLAGSDLDMASAMRNAVSMMHLPLEEALRMASLYPASWIGVEDRMGRIAPGMQADMVLLDAELQVKASWIKGDSEFY